MANRNKLYKFIGRMIADPEFRAALLADPDKVMREAGYEFTEEEKAILRGIDLHVIADELGRPGALPCAG